MSRRLLQVFLIALVPTACGPTYAGAPPDGELVLLQWKAPPGGALGLKVSMESVRTGGGAADFSGMAKMLREMMDDWAREPGDEGSPGKDDADAPEEEPHAEIGTDPGDESFAELGKAFRELFGDLADDFPASYSMTWVLAPRPNGNLAARMILGPSPESQDPKPPDEEDGPDAFLKRMARKMEGTVQLRGEITPRGKIVSFYLEGRQKNLVAMMLELPGRPVKVGDTWPLEMNLISMGHGFVCDRAAHRNQAKLVAVTETPDGDRVATIEYLVLEGVEGTFKGPFGGGEGVPTSMHAGYALGASSPSIGGRGGSSSVSSGSREPG